MPITRICRKESTRKKNTKGNNEGKGEVYNASELGSFGLIIAELPSRRQNHRCCDLARAVSHSLVLASP